MPALSADDREKLLALDDKARAKRAAEKLAKNIPLTAAERVIIGGPGRAPGAFAKNWNELAERLGVTRRAIQEWRKDPRYAAHAPPDRADSRKEVAAWMDFMVAHGLKRADEQIQAGAATLHASANHDSAILAPPAVAGSVADWNRAIAALDHRKKENAIGVMEGTLLVAGELEVPLGATFAAIQMKLAQFPARAARFLVGLRDEQEVEARLRDEIDADLGDFQAAHFIETSLDSVLASLPFDKETTRLLSEFQLSKSQLSAFPQLIARVAIQALRLIGRRPLALNTAPAIAAAPAPPAPDSAARTPEKPRRRAPASARAAKSADSPGEKKPTPKQSAAAKKKRRTRRQPATGPAEVEASIVPAPRAKKKRRR